MSADLEQLLRAAYEHADAGRIEQAALGLQEVVQLQPDHVEALHELGLLHHQLGKNDSAIDLMRRAAAAGPDVMRFHFNFALLLRKLSKHADSVPYFIRATELAPTSPEPLLVLAAALRSVHRLPEAIDAGRRAIALRPEWANSYADLALTLLERGDLEGAIDGYRNAVLRQPLYAIAHSGLLLCLNYHEAITPQELFDEHVEFGRRHTAATAPMKHRAGDRIRIGYLSPDFRQHSVAFFIWPVLANHDRTRFKVTCYFDEAPDKLTPHLQKLPEHWRDVANLSNDDLAKLVADDQIDILIDLAGHTGKNRMPLLARRIAPIQATYLGYPNTTGLASMDYRLTDAIADPPGQTESLHTEKLIRLPRSFFCYLKPTGFPDVGPLPALSAGHVTFAVFTTLVKARPPMMALWAKILHAVPGSRLLFQAMSLDEPQNRDAVTRFFGEQGITPDRFELRGWLDFPQYLKVYNTIDIVLDTSPFSGHTTSCHALWMGTPVVTVAGPTHRSRMGATVLTHVGLAELVARDADEYLRIAAELATDLARLTILRTELRQRMLASPIMDAAGFTRDLETAYVQMIDRARAT